MYLGLWTWTSEHAWLKCWNEHPSQAPCQTGRRVQLFIRTKQAGKLCNQSTLVVHERSCTPNSWGVLSEALWLSVSLAVTNCSLTKDFSVKSLVWLTLLLYDALHSTWALKPDSLDPDSMWSRMSSTRHADYGQCTAITGFHALSQSTQSRIMQHGTQLRSRSKLCGGKGGLGSRSPIHIVSGSKVLCGEPYATGSEQPYSKQPRTK